MADRGVPTLREVEIQECELDCEVWSLCIFLIRIEFFILQAMNSLLYCTVVGNTISVRGRHAMSIQLSRAEGGKPELARKVNMARIVSSEERRKVVCTGPAAGRVLVRRGSDYPELRQ